MTENMGASPAWEPAQPPASAVAREQATTVGRAASEAGSHVAQTAAGQAREVVSETRRQTRDLLGEAGEQARAQVGAQQQKAARQLRTVADELHEMAAKGGQSGLATEVAQQAAERLDGAASWLEQRDSADLLQPVRDFARRRPGTFLVGAALAGLAAGRLTRGMTGAMRSDRQDRSGAQAGPAGEMPSAAMVPPPDPDWTTPMPEYPSAAVPGAATPASTVAPGSRPLEDLPGSGPRTYRPGRES